MKQYKVTHSTKFSYTESVPVCHNLVHLVPRALPFQEVLNYRLSIQPLPLNVVHRRDYFGNELSYFSVDQPHRQLTVTTVSQVKVHRRPALDLAATPAWEQIAQQRWQTSGNQWLEQFPFGQSTGLTRSFPELLEYTRPHFTPQRPIGEATLALTQQIFSDFKFDPQATTVSTPVETVFTERHGVCQDFSHLQTSALRALGLPVRYMSGYLRTTPPSGEPRLTGADASHAWVSVYCGSNFGWIDFDPTNNCLVGSDHVTVAWGRDYNDVCPIQGVIVGGGEHRMQVAVDVELVNAG